MWQPRRTWTKDLPGTSGPAMVKASLNLLSHDVVVVDGSVGIVGEDVDDDVGEDVVGAGEVGDPDVTRTTDDDEFD